MNSNRLIINAEMHSCNKDIQDSILKYYNSMLVGDKENFQNIIHEQSRRFGFGNAGELVSIENTKVSENIEKFSQKLSELNTHFILDQINHCFISDLQASIEVEWRMNWLKGTENEGTGIHWTCFHLAKQDNNWSISSILDRGMEINKANQDYSIETNRQKHEYYKIEIENFLSEFFEVLSDSNEEKFESIWNDDALRFNHGNEKQLYVTNKLGIQTYTLQGLKNACKNNPNFFVKHIIKSIKHIEVSDLTATVELEWEMYMPDSTGTHYSCFHLVRQHNNWQIVGLLDRGIEQ